jgi:hypothetical protein
MKLFDYDNTHYIFPRNWIVFSESKEKNKANVFKFKRFL